MTTPFYAGSKVTAASLDAVAPLSAFKYADQNTGTSSGSTTLVQDSDLSLSLAAGGTYVGVAMVVFAAATAADYKCTFTCGAAQQGGWGPNLYVGSGGTAIVADAQFLAFAATATIGGQGTADNQQVNIQWSLVMGATAGSLQWEFAQASSDASNCWTRANSYLLGWQIA